MKIYMKNTDSKKINIRLINEYKCKTEKITFILSQNGIIRIMNNKLIQINIIDKEPKEVTINNHEFICDESRFINNYEVYQIPVNHYVEDITTTYYRLRPNSRLYIVVEHKDEQINNVYFSTDEKINMGYIQEDINTFFTLLKII